MSDSAALSSASSASASSVQTSSLTSQTMDSSSLQAPPLSRDRLIVALDFPAPAEAFALVERLEGRARWFKVGLELFIEIGRAHV